MNLGAGMKRVTGIGGIFFKSGDPERLGEWYGKHLGLKVEDLDAPLAQLRAEGCEGEAKVEESELGNFGWVMDPEGNRIELWQPPEGR